MTPFKDAAKYYKYRAKYPDTLIEYIKNKLPRSELARY